MAKKGRPFTYQSDDDRPVTISVRLPAELTDLVKRYAGAHGQMPISELIREGLEWRIGDGDPRGMGMYLGEPTDAREKRYYANTETASDLDTGAVLADMQTAMALLKRQEASIQAVVEMLERQRILTSNSTHSSNTAMTATVADISHDNNTVIQEPDGTPTLDHAKFYLGELCPGGHEWNGTGKTLKRKQGNRCMACENEGKKRRRQAKRQALEASAD